MNAGACAEDFCVYQGATATTCPLTVPATAFIDCQVPLHSKAAPASPLAAAPTPLGATGSGSTGSGGIALQGGQGRGGGSTHRALIASMARSNAGATASASDSRSGRITELAVSHSPAYTCGEGACGAGCEWGLDGTRHLWLWGEPPRCSSTGATGMLLCACAGV